MAGKGTLTVRVIGDTKPFEQSMTGLEKTAGKMRDIGTKMSIGLTAPLLLVGRAAGNTASDLNESLSKANTIFGESAGEVEKWSEGMAKAFGQSKRQALEAAGSFGNMFTQLGVATDEAMGMSTAMTELASDFASFHNADISDVIAAQSAAFRGEYDSVQRFVPTINAAAVAEKALEMGLAKTSGELTQQHKALAVYTLLTDGAGAAAGDFARTSDQVANKQRIAAATAEDASASLGQSLQPAMEKIAEVATVVAGAFAGLSSGWQTTIVVAAAVLVALGPVIGVIGSLITVVQSLRVAMAFLAANPIVLVIAAVAALAAALVIAYQKSETFRDVVDRAFDVVQAGAAVMWEVVRPILEGLARAFRAAGNGIASMSNRVGDLLDWLGKIPKAVDRALGPLDELAGKAGGLVGKAGGLLGKIPGFDDGGVVPGPRGAPRLILAHGGETVLPTHKGSMQVASGAAASPTTVNITNNYPKPEPPSESASRILRRVQYGTGYAG